MQEKKSLVLLIEDEHAIRKVLAIVLEEGGYKVVECNNGKEGIRLAASIHPDLIVLDLGLPDINGADMIITIREWSQVPIIVCSASNEDKAVIRAFDTGADDYVTKPFNPDILLARIHACMRKTAAQEAGAPDLVNGNIRMNLVRHEIFVNEKKTVFTPKEYDLLRYFLIHRGKMLMHRQILEEVWGPAHSDDMQYLRVYVSQLREKIEPDPAAPAYIITEPGIGYRMEIISTPPPLSIVKN